LNKYLPKKSLDDDLSFSVLNQLEWELAQHPVLRLWICCQDVNGPNPSVFLDKCYKGKRKCICDKSNL